MIYDKIEDIPWYLSVKGEIDEVDCYRLKKLEGNKYDLIIDAGANIGCFTRYARQLFPNAKIVSVEPNAENFVHLNKFTQIDNWHPIHAAIGKGQLWRNIGAANGAGESYVSSGIGYEQDAMEEAERFGAVEKSAIETITIPQLIKRFSKDGDRVLIKIDIEGGEHAIFSDKESMEILKNVDYLCAELHLYALESGQMYDEVSDLIGTTIGTFMRTHTCTLDNVIFTASKNK